MTREEFIAHEVYVWGEDYIFNLIEQGYSPKLTNRGWYWFLPQPALDTERNSCYAGSVG